MKKILLITFAFMLNGCLYSFEGECIRPIIQVVSNGCYKNKGKEFPLVAGYQKKITLGRTNSEQRWKDLVSCGGKYGDYNLTYYPEHQDIEKFYQKVDECMLNKGYIYIKNNQCGYQDPKWDNGVCNL